LSIAIIGEPGGTVPTPAHTSLEEIVRAGRRLLERDGLEGLTMQRVADSVGVRAPSLYKRIDGRAELIRLIAEDVVSELAGILEAFETGDAREDLAALARAFRAFAHANPAAYDLVFARLPEGREIDPATNARSSAPVVRTAGRLAGPEHALDAARMTVAWAHGFISMELAGAFRLGGDVDAAFEFGIARLTAAIADTGTSERARP
jgi:AcrR family transcriptional regulator